MVVACLAAGAVAGIARADASDDRLSAGGYFRLQAFTDFQGGNGQLGLSPLGCGVGGPCIYGRLMNEGPDLILEMRYLMIGSDKTPDTPWAALVLRAEGESFLGTDSGNGNLSNYAITRFAVDAGNLLLQNVTWRIGVLWYEPNNLGLYDMFLDDLFYGVMGASAFYKTPTLDLLVGIGDEGWQLLGSHYNTVYHGRWLGALAPEQPLRARRRRAVRLRARQPGQPERAVADSRRQLPASTTSRPRSRASTRRTRSPGTLFPNPTPTSAENWKAVGYLGFGKLGPLDWNSFYIHYMRKPPLTNYTETFQAPGAVAPQSYTIYVSATSPARSTS